MKHGNENTGNNVEEDWLTIVRRKVGSLRFGVVQVIVHDGKVTQIESTEKTRIESRVQRA